MKNYRRRDMEKMQGAYKVEQVLNKRISLAYSDGTRSDMVEGEPIAWTKRRQLYGSSFLSLGELTLMVRNVLRGSGEVSFEELILIFHGALECDLRKALNSLITSNHARALGKHQYEFVKNKPTLNDANEIREEVEAMQRLKYKILSNPSEEAMTTSDESFEDDEYKTKDDSALLSKMSTISVVDSLDNFDQTQGHVSDEYSRTSQHLRDSSRLLKDSYKWVRVSRTVNNDKKDKPEPALPPKTDTSVNDSGVALNGSTGELRCVTAEDYIRRTAMAHTACMNRAQPPSTLDTEKQDRYRWTNKTSDPVRKDPVTALESYCVLSGKPTPGYTVTFMPQEKVHFCVLQVDNCAFRSYPSMALTYKRAVEIAAEKAVSALEGASGPQETKRFKRLQVNLFWERLGNRRNPPYFEKRPIMY
ncbi:uncharacterized protein LOC111253790 isoform X3 [Varroa destructor]|uniref:Uncharacterized protein n=1 Tax=Varroa destructor TaxID=109461 RepID=A0A7M7MJ52_VARDE|nr:uncharacterized protein LOC111253790 isoform X3 [Varroa destructor]